MIDNIIISDDRILAAQLMKRRHASGNNDTMNIAEKAIHDRADLKKGGKLKYKRGDVTEDDIMDIVMKEKLGGEVLSPLLLSYYQCY